MATPVITPNMFLTEPAIGNTLSPTWAQDLNADIVTIDQHNHTPGEGVQIPPAGLNINSSLSFQGNNLIDLNSAVFSGAISGTPNLLSIYTNGTDLFYEDVNGNSIQLTKLGAPNAGTGNIQGLPSTPIGGAGISWVNGQSTFQFLQDSGTVGANIDVGTAILRYPGSYPTPSGTNYIALEVPSSISAGYSIIFPTALPGASSFVTLDNGGNLAASIPIAGGITGSNITSSVVLSGDPSSVGDFDVGGNLNVVGSATIAGNVTAGPTNEGAYFFGSNQFIAISGNTVSGAGNALYVASISGQLPIITGSISLGSPLKVIRGNVSSTGSVFTGEGFTSSVAGPSYVYTVSFVTAFQDTPAVTVTAQEFGGFFNVASTSNVSTSGFTVTIIALIGSFAGNPAPFSFTAIGQLAS